MSENATDPKTQLIDNLKELHLPAMQDGFEEVALRAQQESQSYERYLLELTERECQARRGNRIERLLRDSRLPQEKTLESLDLKRLPAKVVQPSMLIPLYSSESPVSCRGALREPQGGHKPPLQ